MEKETLGARLFLAHNAVERRLGRKVSFAELGAMIAKEEGREDAKGKPMPYSGGNVLRWERDQKRPSFEAVAALARLAGMRGGFLVFNERDGDESATGSSPMQELPVETYERIEPRRKAVGETPRGAKSPRATAPSRSRVVKKKGR